MRRQMVSLFVVLALVFSQMPVWAQATSGKSDLAAGIRQVEEGDFEVAAGTLDKAIKAMAGDRTRSKELAKAYLYLAVANLGMSREANARARMLEAIKSDESLSLSSAEFPPNVIQLFEEVRQEAGYKPASRAASQPTSTAAPEKKKGGSKLPIILIGAAAVGGGALLLMPKNSPPTVDGVTVSPSGVGMAGLTSYTFQALNPKDPDNNIDQTTWDFGDGVSASGTSVSHIFTTAGTYTVKVTVTDKKSKSASATTDVKVNKSLTGRWTGPIRSTTNYNTTVNLTQNGSNLTGNYVDQYPGTGSVTGTVSSQNYVCPCNVTFTVSMAPYNPWTFTGTLTNDQLNGQANGSGFVNAPWTLTRQ